MSEIVYSIANIFSKEMPDGALGQYEAKRYLIAPYQRGYKWSSDQKNSPVQLLMSDIKDAFGERSNDYILQYLTVSTANNNNDVVLEIIDGQQRLTTLTILISIISNRLKTTQQPFTNYLLSYKVRPIVSAFMDDFIYSNISELLKVSWKAFALKYPHYDEQDIYYLFNAVRKIDELLIDEPELDKFYIYVKDNVKLILNHVENTPNCEKVFANLNTNKVDLTSAELIKALILTKAAREKSENEKTLQFKEVLDKRTSMGRQWDDINNWCNKPDIKSFYFNNFDDPIHELLRLLAIRYGYKSPSDNDNRYELFNFLQSHIKKGVSPVDLFNDLKELKSILYEWFQDHNIYNLLGYLIVAKGSKFKVESLVLHTRKSKPELYAYLVDLLRMLIPDKLKELEYGNNNDEIHRLLLALSVYTSDQRFDYHSFQQEDWSLEHIFPQNPEKFPSALHAPDIRLIKSLIGEKLLTPLILDESKQNKYFENIRLGLNKKLEKTDCDLTPEEIIFICNMMKSSLLNSIGNMALLTRADNSSNSNGMFNKKRLKMVGRISNGSFVPKHTYDVFSKLLSKEMNTDLSVWTDADINAHYIWIENIVLTKLFKQ